jgi:DNA-3-methyladenine glycosylase I
MMLTRCPWVPENDQLYIAYHDTEWGVPIHKDRLIFEFLILEGFQAGLSWSTILRKRENFRRAFDGFDPNLIANYNDAKIAQLLEDPGYNQCSRLFTDPGRVWQLRYVYLELRGRKT